MAEQKNPQAQPELSLSEQTRIRREKLTNLQAEGQNPFVITRFDWDATSQQIKDNFDAMEGKPVKVAGRLMSKRGMGKVSFCDLHLWKSENLCVKPHCAAIMISSSEAVLTKQSPAGSVL